MQELRKYRLDQIEILRTYAIRQLQNCSLEGEHQHFCVWRHVPSQALICVVKTTNTLTVCIAHQWQAS